MATARNFTSSAAPTATTTSINATDTVVTVAALTGYPAVPFTAVLDRNGPTEEVVEVTGVSGLNLTITRGIESGVPGQIHGINTRFEHIASARDFQDANNHILLGSIHLGSQNVFASNIAPNTITGSQVSSAFTFAGSAGTTSTFAVGTDLTAGGNISASAGNVTANKFTSTAAGGESHFNSGTYADPDVGVTRDAKFGHLGIAVLGGIKTDTVNWTGAGTGSTLTLSGAGTALTVNNNALVSGNLTVTGTISGAGSNFVTLDTTQTITGTKTFSATTTTLSGVSASTLALTGGSTALNVTNNASIGGSLSVTGNVNVGPILTFGNPGVGNDTKFVFNKTSDHVGITVREHVSDQTWYAFTFDDNPDSASDAFTMQWSDFQNPGSGWTPFYYSNTQMQYHAKRHLFYGNVDASTSSFATTNNGNFGNRDYLPTNTPTMSVGTGTLTMTVDASGYSGSNASIAMFVELDSATTFKWGFGSGTTSPVYQQTGVAVATSPITLSNGVKINWNSTSGGVTGDRWTFRVFSSGSLTAKTLNTTAVATIDGGGNILQLKPGASTDHVYIGLYARSATPSTRSASVGFLAGASTTLSFQNELTNGNINLVTNGTGSVFINSAQAWFTGVTGRPVTNAAIAFDTITGGAGAGVGNIGSQQVDAYNIKDGAITSAKISLAAAATILTSASTGNTRSSMFRYVASTANFTTTDPVTGARVDGLQHAGTGVSRVSDSQAYGGAAIKATAGTTPDATTIQFGPYYGSNTNDYTGSPGLAPGNYRVTVFVKVSSTASSSAALSINAHCNTAGVVQNDATQFSFNADDLLTTYVGASIPLTILADTAGSNGLEIRTQFKSAAAVDVYVSHITIEPWNGLAQQEVTTDYIKDLSVTNAKVNDMSVAKLTAGQITTDDIFLGTGGHVYAGNKNGGRVELNAAGLYSYQTCNIAHQWGGNSGFELNTTAGFGINAATVSVVNDATVEGSKAGEFTATGTGAGPFLQTSNSKRLPATVGVQYTTSIYAKGQGGAAVGKATQAKIEWYDNTGALLSTSNGNSVTLSGSYQRVTCTATAPTNAVAMTPTFYCATSATADVIRFDAAQVEVGSAATVYTTYVTSAPTVSLLANGQFSIQSSTDNLLTHTGAAGVDISGTGWTEIGSGSTRTSLGSGETRVLAGGGGASVLRGNVNLSDLVQGQTYVVSITVRNDQGTSQSFNMDWCDTGPISYTIPAGTTIRVANPAALPNNGLALYNSTYRFIDIGVNTSNNLIFSFPQLEMGPVATPYSSGQRIQITPSGLTLNNGTTDTVKMDAAGNFTMQSAASGARMVLTPTSLDTFSAGGVNTVHLDNTGAFKLQSATANQRLELTASTFKLFNSSSVAVVSLDGAAGTGTIGGWTLGATQLTAGSGASTIALDTGSGIWSGTSAFPGSAGAAKFAVSTAGVLWATSGVVGGWTLGTATLTGGNVTIDSAGVISAGTGTAIVKMQAGTGLWAGDSTFSSGPFRVDTAGALTATKATITGTLTSGAIGTSAISAGGIIQSHKNLAITNNEAASDTTYWAQTVSAGSPTITRATATGSGVGAGNAIEYNYSATARTFAVATYQFRDDPTNALIAGCQYTLSFSAKSISGNTDIGMAIMHSNGSHQVLPVQNLTITTSWARYSTTFTAAFNSDSADLVYIPNRTPNNAYDFQIAGVQIELGALSAYSDPGSSIFVLDNSGNMWLGNGRRTSAPFQVTPAGAVAASNVAITGGTLAIGSSNNIFKVDSSGNAWTGNASLASAKWNVTNTGIMTAGTGTGPKIVADGTTGILTIYNSSGTAVLSGDGSGNLVMTGTISAGGSNFGSSAISGGTFTGSTFQTNTNATTSVVRMDSAGVRGYDASSNVLFNLNASGASTIGSWTIGASTLTGTSVTLDSAGALTVGSGSSIVKMQQGVGLWAGSSTITGLGSPTSPTVSSYVTTGGTWPSSREFVYWVTGIDSSGRETATSLPLTGTFPGAVTAPTIQSVTTAIGVVGSGWSGTYFFVVTALGLNGNGESVKSNEVNLALSGSAAPLFKITPVAAASAYRIYYGTTTGTYTNYLDVTTVSPTLVWAARSTTNAGTPPASTTSADTATGTLNLAWSSFTGASSYRLYKYDQGFNRVGYRAVAGTSFSDTTPNALSGGGWTSIVQPHATDDTAPPFSVTPTGALTAIGTATLQGVFRSSFTTQQRVEIGPTSRTVGASWTDPIYDGIGFYTGDPSELGPGSITVSRSNNLNWWNDRWNLNITAPLFGVPVTADNVPMAPYIQIQSPTRGSNSSDVGVIKLISGSVSLEAWNNTGGATYLAANATTGITKLQVNGLTNEFDVASAWTNFTPTWTAATTNPTNNATYKCRYKIVGKTVTYHFWITFGATGTYGTGSWSFTLPVTAANSFGGSASLGLLALAKATNSTSVFVGHAFAPSTATSTMQLQNPGNSSLWDVNTPGGVWASGDSIRGVLVYEAA
jgi:fibronectin-binding autotransporter adhesin